MDVPELVLFDILLYLPVISLLRFKTVCKSWCFVIGSSSFTSAHIHHNSGKNNLIVWTYQGQLFRISGRKHELLSNLDLECIYPKDSLYDIHSCNGIVCLGFTLSAGYWRICLWNPATKQLRELPESSYLCLKRRTVIEHVFAFGFDKEINDYKVVSISLDYHAELEGGLVQLEGSLVQVYNIRTDSWQTIHEGVDFPVVCFFDETICNGETFLCIGQTADRNVTCVIFYFDLSDEVYGTVSLPIDPYKVGVSSNQYPAFLDDKIAYITWSREESSCSYYDIWVLNELGVKEESWNKVCRLKDNFLPCQPSTQLYLSNNGDFIVARKSGEVDWELYLYDLVTGEVKNLGVQHVGGTISYTVCSITSYNERLVSIKSRDGTKAM